jgi:hypothetical protein
VQARDAYTAGLMTAADDALRCRTCGTARGENIAEGTRCSACGFRHALILWLSVTVAATVSAASEFTDIRSAVVVCLVALVATPPAFIVAVLAHELVHAAAALLLGQTVTRVLVRPNGYRWRMGMTLLTEPIVSMGLALVCYTTTTDWPLAWRTAALLFAGANAVMAAITSIPVATFGGRVWSDVASVLYLARGDATQIEEHMLLSAQDRIAMLADADLHARAIATARAAVATAPSAFLAHSLLAYALHRAGQWHEAREVACVALSTWTHPLERIWLASRWVTTSLEKSRSWVTAPRAAEASSFMEEV